jgi:SAM-dependent methyltransferase
MHSRVVLSVVAGLLGYLPAWGQKVEFDFYPEFRNDVMPKHYLENPRTTLSEIIADYSAALKAAGVAANEIERRAQLILSDRPTLEADYWDRFYLNPESKVNRAPNAFLVEMTQGQQPGVALDYAMGEGRNSIYLAQLGWHVWGFDPSVAGVAIANKRASALGLTLHTAAVSDHKFEFGRDRFDLILFSWAMPQVPIEGVLESLKRGGIVIMECAANYVGQNGMLKLFDALEIKHYEMVHQKADFYDRQEVDIVRLLAVKP